MFINPLNWLPWTIGSIYQGFSSFARFKKFLNTNLELNKSIESSSPKPSVIDNVAISLTFQKIIWPTKGEESKRSNFSLNEIDLKIQQGTINIIIGSVSSGKSALLLSILGEMVPSKENRKDISSSEGRHVNGSLAYVPQDPWLQKQTIKVLLF